MARTARWITPLIALGVASGVALADKDKEPSPETRAFDAMLYKGLRDVINRGVDLYRNDDPAACYRLYEGSLMTMRPLLDHRPELQKVIDKGLTGARRDPVMWRRAYSLRSLLDKVRADLNPSPRKDLLHKPKVEDEKKDDAKEEKKEKPKEEKKDPPKPKEKKDEPKKDEPKKNEPKKDEQKKDDK